MRNYVKWGFFKAFGIIAITAIIIFAGCKNDTGGNTNHGGDAPPLFIEGTVSINGNAYVGETLTADISELSGSGAPSYTWQQDNKGDGTFKDIDGGTVATYHVTDANLRNKIRVKVSRAGYSGIRTNDPPPVVTLPPLKTIDDVIAAIGGTSTWGSTADDPIPLTMTSAFNLGNMTEPGSNWQQLLKVLAIKSKFVALDLSACPINGGTVFAPYKDSLTGEDRVVSLVLPTVAITMSNGTSEKPTFTHFTALTTVSGAGINEVSDYAFYCNFGTLPLTSVSFPVAKYIGDSAFRGGTALTSVTSANFPAAGIIGDSAFSYCFGLTSVDLPRAETIGDYAFADCNRLASVSIPKAVEVKDDNSFDRVGTDAGVTSFTITIKEGCNFNNSNLQWGTGQNFLDVYYEGIISGAKVAGGTYTYTKSNSKWTYTPFP